MRAFLLAVLLALPLPVHSEEAPWLPMSGAEITAALTERTLRYSTSTQVFYASGRTLYDAGRPSWGYWRVEADQYCSQWPPSDLWACYKMDRRGDTVRFVGDSGDITEGAYAD